MDDPVELATLQHLIELSAEVEAQLSTSDATPIKAILSRARDEAAAAVSKLIDAPPERADIIRELQTQVRRYRDLVRWLRGIIAEGKDAGEMIDDVQTLELRRLIVDIDEETLAAMGRRPPGAPSE